MTWTARPTLDAGVYPTAADMEAVLDQIDSLTAAGWVDFSSTVAWTSTGTAPAFGNATKVAEYWQPAGSDLVLARYKFTWGGTTTFGTGTYFFSLPVSATASEIQMPGAGGGNCVDATVNEYAMTVKIESASTFRLQNAGGASAGSAGSTAPFTWGSGDILSAMFWYSVV